MKPQVEKMECGAMKIVLHDAWDKICMQILMQACVWNVLPGLGDEMVKLFNYRVGQIILHNTPMGQRLDIGRKAKEEARGGIVG